jgi:hypothetical protein
MSITAEFPLDLFKKCMAHLDNENDHEALNAMRRARAMLAKHGLRFSELDRVLAPPDPWASTGFDSNLDEVLRRAAAQEDVLRRRAAARAQREEEERRRKAAAEAAARAEEERQRWEAQKRAEEELRRELEPKRQAIIERYGSERAAFASRGLQRSVETEYALALRETRPSQGQLDLEPPDELPEPVLEAIRRPGPFPTTITAAKVELDYWTEREAEIAILHYCAPGSLLSRPCLERRNMVETAFKTGLRATSLAELILRQRACVEDEWSDPTGEQDAAILADLEALSSESVATQHPITAATKHPMKHPTTTDRRNEIIRILTGPEGEGLSDREIAKRLGVANSTVSRIRKRLGLVE